MENRRLSRPALLIFLSRSLARVEGSAADALASQGMREAATGMRKVSSINGAEAARPAINKLVVSAGKC